MLLLHHQWGGSMKRLFGVCMTALLCLFPVAGMAGTFSGIVVTVDAGPGAGELTLHWTGGLAPYTVYRSTTPSTIDIPSNVLGQTGSLTWTDLPPTGDTFFYEVTGSGCADGTVEQVFSPLMQGCAGAIQYAMRGTPCAPGCHVCSAPEWVANRNSTVPTYDYWSADNLGYASNGISGSCAVAISGPLFCQSAGFTGPMLVCTPSQPDGMGNRCGLINCGLNTTTPNQYFGGCPLNNTAGAICCCP
jgi:hypothetical protein